ncbi:MAG TPA: sigma-70 family RNA polymerase sigma factor [Gemmataceae bacterium]|nr:sigma-70 family RNA polymerase sigma factor [Gemmataceae bacterium]
MSAPSPPADDTSSSLLARVKNHDADACVQLVQWIGPFILRWCQRARLQAADRDDVSQQVLKNIWSRLATFRKDKPNDSFRGWVYTITRNCILDLWERRRGAPHPLPVELPAEADPSEARDLKRRALHLLIQEVIARHAGDSGFQAFYRTAVDGLSAVEAAQELGLSPDAVRQHKSRWIKRLRDRLLRQFGDLLS